MNRILGYNIFVYGTLRQAGEYHRHYLRYSPCLHRQFLLSGYALYDYAGLYPYMIPERGATVVGEVYQIDIKTKIALDEFEDVDQGLYRFAFIPEHQFYTYLKADTRVANMPRVPNGDWLTYCSTG